MRDKTLSALTDLENRFIPPGGWMWCTYKTDNHRILRYGYCVPDDPKAIILFMPGLNDVPEKYFETFRHWIEQGYGVVTFDWFGQAGSGRYLNNPSKRHSKGFMRDIDDFFALYEARLNKDIIGTLPCFAVGHSMGGNLLLRILMRDQTWCKGAIYTAPMFGIKALRYVPGFVVRGAYRMFDKHYVPGGADWDTMSRLPFPVNILTRDETRYALESQWMTHDFALRIGGVTFGWLYHAWQSCKMVQKTDLSSVTLPSFIFTAEHEHLVDNKRTAIITKRLPNADADHLNDSYHEPLLERDSIRDDVLRKINAFVTKHI